MRPSYRVIRRLAWIYFRFFHRLHIEGLEHLPAREPFLLASNHASFLDPPVVACCVPRELAFLARRSLFKIPGLACLIRRLGTLPIDRGGMDRAAFRASLGALSRGRPLLLFPEGTRGKGPVPGPFRRGIEFMARKAGVSVVPVAVLGTHRALPRGRLLPWPSRVEVRFGEPIRPEELTRQGVDWLRGRVIELLGT